MEVFIMNKLVKKSLAGVLAGVMAATSLVGSITAFATVSKEEAMNPKKLTFGTAAVFEKKDGAIQDVYYFETPAADADRKDKKVDYNFTFSSEAHLKDKTTENERDDTKATVSVYKYNPETKEADTTAVLTLEYDAKGANRYVASERFLMDKDDKQVGSALSKTYAYVDSTETKKALDEKSTYMAKVETYGSYEATVVKDGKETKETRYTKASLTVDAWKEVKSDWTTTIDTKDPGYTTINETPGFNGAYYQTRVYGGAVIATYCGEASDIVVPNTIGTDRVTGFAGVSSDIPHSRITSVTLGENVKKVSGFGSEKKPFINLTKLTLNEGLVTIGENAFAYCTGLTGQLVIPATVKTIEAGAFYETGYASAKIQNKDTEIKGTALGFGEVLNEATANPSDVYEGVKKGFFVVAPAGAKAFDWGKKNDVPVIDLANCTHVYGDAVVKKATYWAKGSETKTCAVCGNVETKEIAQKKVALSTVKSAKKGQITVKTKSVDAAIKGYKIQYATKKDFSNAKTVKVATTKKALSKTIKGLKSGKKYYVRVRVYKSGKNGAWSAAKAVKVK
jgi:hypothetical protein